MQRAGVVRDPKTGDWMIPESVRPDGSIRPARKVKPNYVPQDEMPNYRQTKQLIANISAVAQPGSTAALGMTPDHPQYQQVEKERRAYISAQSAQLQKDGLAVPQQLLDLAKQAESQGMTKSAKQREQKRKAKQAYLEKQKLGDSGKAKEQAPVTNSSFEVDIENLSAEAAQKRLRNVKKKYTKTLELEKQVSDGKLTPNDDQKEKIHHKLHIEQEITLLEKRLHSFGL